MTETPTESSAGPGEANVRLPWESLGNDDAPAAPAASTATATPFVTDDEDAGETLADADSIESADADPAAEDVAEAAYDDAGSDDAASADDASDAAAVDYESPVPAEPLVDDLGPPPRGGGWTLTLLCVGIGLIACCVLIPQTDANRRLAYEREKLKTDLDSIRKQVATNDEFLRRVADDPNLAERLAQRQMKIIRQGTRVLDLKKQPGQAGGGGIPAAGAAADEMSPFHLVHVAPPPPMPPYEPVGGVMAGLCYNPHTRLYVTGFGLFLMAAGLVLGFGPKSQN